ncbi:solute carrier family 49 member A3-like [Styela clava]
MSRRGTYDLNVNHQLRNLSSITERENEEEFTVTWKRWLVLAIVSLLNMSVAMIWLCFSPVAYKAVSYYGTSLIVINTLSLIFMIVAIPMGFIVMWVMEKYGLRVCILLCGWFGCIGSLLRICSTIEGLSDDERLVFVFIGQIIAALGSPFGLYTPAKLAGYWFPESQRTIANTIAASSNPVGVILVGLISPLFMFEDGYYHMQLMLIVYAAPITVGAILASIFITSDGPQHPPSYGGTVKKTEKIWGGFKEILRNSMFMLLAICLGTGIGLYASFATLLEQVLCPWGYTDQMAGVSASVLTASGIVGAIIISTVVDKTKKFTEALKSVYFLTALGVILLSFTHYIYMGYGIVGEVALIGFFAFTIYPVGAEIAAECTYPIGTGLSTGIIQLSGQLQSVVLILVLSVIGQPMEPEQVIENNSQCHHNSTIDEQTGGDDNTYDMRISVWVCAGLMTFTSLILTIFFRPKYLRMEAEKEHNNAMYMRRKSHIPGLANGYVNGGLDAEDGTDSITSEKDGSISTIPEEYHITPC